MRAARAILHRSFRPRARAPLCLALAPTVAAAAAATAHLHAPPSPSRCPQSPRPHQPLLRAQPAIWQLTPLCVPARKSPHFSTACAIAAQVIQDEPIIMAAAAFAASALAVAAVTAAVAAAALAAVAVTTTLTTAARAVAIAATLASGSAPGSALTVAALLAAAPLAAAALAAAALATAALARPQVQAHTRTAVLDSNPECAACRAHILIPTTRIPAGPRLPPTL